MKSLEEEYRKLGLTFERLDFPQNVTRNLVWEKNRRLLIIHDRDTLGVNFFCWQQPVSEDTVTTAQSIYRNPVVANEGSDGIFITPSKKAKIEIAVFCFPESHIPPNQQITMRLDYYEPSGNARKTMGKLQKLGIGPRATNPSQQKALDRLVRRSI